MDKRLVAASLLLTLSLTVVSCLPMHLRMHLRGKRAFSYIANQTVCVVDNIVYHDGDPIPTDDPCESCKCRPPGFSCVLRECEVKPGCKAIRRDGECCPEYQCGCEHNGKFFNDGDRIPNAESPCYSCYCQGSSITCALADCKFRFDCEPEYVPGECCPRYDHCPPDPSMTTTTTTTTTTTPEPTTMRFSSIFTTFMPTTTPSAPATSVVPVHETAAAPTTLAALPVDAATAPPTSARPQISSVSSSTVAPVLVKDATQPEIALEATTVPAVAEAAVPVEDAATVAPEAIAEPSPGVITEIIIKELTTLPGVAIESITAAAAPAEVFDENANAIDRDDVTTIAVPAADPVVGPTVAPVVAEEPVVTVDAASEEKFATASLVEEAYQTTKSWMPDSALTAEHKDIEDLIITTVIPPIIADTLEIEPETEAPQRPSEAAVVVPVVSNSTSSNNATAPVAISDAVAVTAQPDEIFTERAVVSGGAVASETTTSSVPRAAAIDEAANFIF